MEPQASAVRQAAARCRGVSPEALRVLARAARAVGSAAEGVLRDSGRAGLYSACRAKKIPTVRTRPVRLLVVVVRLLVVVSRRSSICKSCRGWVEAHKWTVGHAGYVIAQTPTNLPPAAAPPRAACPPCRPPSAAPCCRRPPAPTQRRPPPRPPGALRPPWSRGAGPWGRAGGRAGGRAVSRRRRMGAETLQPSKGTRYHARDCSVQNDRRPQHRVVHSVSTKCCKQRHAAYQASQRPALPPVYTSFPSLKQYRGSPSAAQPPAPPRPWWPWDRRDGDPRRPGDDSGRPPGLRLPGLPWRKRGVDTPGVATISPGAWC